LLPKACSEKPSLVPLKSNSNLTLGSNINLTLIYSYSVNIGDSILIFPYSSSIFLASTLMSPFWLVIISVFLRVYNRKKTKAPARPKQIIVYMIKAILNRFNLYSAVIGDEELDNLLLEFPAFYWLLYFSRSISCLRSTFFKESTSVAL